MQRCSTLSVGDFEHIDVSFALEIQEEFNTASMARTSGNISVVRGLMRRLDVVRMVPPCFNVQWSAMMFVCTVAACVLINESADDGGKASISSLVKWSLTLEYEVRAGDNNNKTTSYRCIYNINLCTSSNESFNDI